MRPHHGPQRRLLSLPELRQLHGLLLNAAAPGSRWDLALTGAVAVLLAYSSMFGEITAPNERSRVYLTVALLDDHSISIDGPADRFGPVADAARFRGRLYTDKAPGSSFIGAIVYGVARLFEAPDDFTIAELVGLMRTWVMVPLGIVGFVLMRSLLRRFGTSEPAVDVASLAFALGTAYFHYAAAFFGHAVVAVLFLAALWVLPHACPDRPAGRLTSSDPTSKYPSIPSVGSSERARPANLSEPAAGLGDHAWVLPDAGADPPPPTRAGNFALSGAALGLAGFTEYQAIVPAALFFTFVTLRERRRPARALAFAAGAAPFAIALLAYHDAAFGGPFELSYDHLASAGVQAHHQRGIAGVGAPTKGAVLGSLFSLHRGLVATSPIAALFPVGLLALERRGYGALSALLFLVVVYFLAFVFGADMWFGGWGFGPRLLVPALGPIFLAVGPALDLAFGSALLGGLARGLGAWGIVYAAAVAEVFPELPPEFASPLADAVGPALERGLHSPNILTRVGADFGVATLVPAWALTAAGVGLVFGRGLRRLRSTPRRALALLIAAAIPLGAAAAIARAGPTIRPTQQARFLGWMEALTAREERSGARAPRHR